MLIRLGYQQLYSTLSRSRRILIYHNQNYHDEFSFLKQNPKSIKSYLELEKNRSKEFFALDPVNVIFQDYLNEASQRKDTRSEDLPEQFGDYNYTGKYATFKSGNDYQIIQRTHIEKKVVDFETVLDISQVSAFVKYHKTMQLTKTVISDDHNLIAFGIDLQNDERTTWMIKSVVEDQPRKYREQLVGCVNAKFSQCGTHLIYVQMDDMFRPSQVKLHKLGTQQEDDVLIFEESDGAFYIDIQETKDKKYYVILSGSKTVNKIYVIPRESSMSRSALPKITCLIPESLKCLAFVQHANERFYVLTNRGVHDFKVQTVEDASINAPQFKDFYFPEPGEIIQELDLFEEHLVLYLKRVSESFIKVISLKGEETYSITIPSSVLYGKNAQKPSSLITKLYQKMITRNIAKVHAQQPNEVIAATFTPGLNWNFNQARLRFHVDTPLMYNQVYDFDFKAKQLHKLQDCTLSGKPFNQSNFICTLIHAPSHDGTLIPITLVHHRDLKLDRQNKLLLHSYGAYGIAHDVPFNVVYLSALERGWVLAFAHIRGGNELGHEWHTQTIEKGKMKSIEDLQSCAMALIAKGYTHPTLLCGLSSSAGATLLAAAVNMRPELWKCVVYSSPFLDVLGNLMDRELPLSVPDYEEFGNPIDSKDMFEFIKSYSPQNNTKKQNEDQVYPAKYIMAGSNDYRAPIWGVMKYVLRFRERARQSEKVDDVLDRGLVVDVVDAGHYGSVGIMAGIEERAKYMAFFEYFVGEGNREISIENLTADIDSGLAIQGDDNNLKSK